MELTAPGHIQAKHQGLIVEPMPAGRLIRFIPTRNPEAIRR
jgi:hypothetical protein